MEVLRNDVTVVGAGIAGLWSAKELVDQGLQVTVVEKNTQLAGGATTRNEGWLHAGTYHSFAIDDEAEAQRVTERTLYGHNEIVRFAPESIDHDISYALTTDEDSAQKAIERWGKAGVAYREVVPAALGADEGLDVAAIGAAFEVADKSVNTPKLCRKLAGYIIENGGQILTDVSFRPFDDNVAVLSVADADPMVVRSEQFLLTCGVGAKELVETVTGQELLMRYFKAHLLATPRLTRHNYFYLEPGEAGVMSHGTTSIVGMNRDGIELTEPDSVPIPEKEVLVRSALTRMLPGAVQTMGVDSRAV